ncbi:MAG TPA: PLP-dependent aminotransferase family protein [Bryobacteraceae bacterium]|nr:PLP-dependent aminotransferase family protein [Bryobacteraceae bacterium]
MLEVGKLNLDTASEIPLYRQLADAISKLIETSALAAGDRLPATRELSARLGLNRTTVSAAYALLEQSGKIEGQVGRGSFVAALQKNATAPPGPDWDALLLAPEAEPKPSRNRIDISFASSSPGDDQLPLTQFRRIARQVIESPEAADILHLGSSLGYGPLRRYLLKQASEEGIARPGDDLIVTNGCQQALDLLGRLFARPGLAVLAEDPVYRGLLRVFSRSGAELIGIPMDENGMDVDALESALLRHRPKLLLVTPTFQNPTGTTLPLERRERIVALANRHGCALVESDIYSELRYRGTPLPTLKQLDRTGSAILLRSYSKIGFPGLRVGWVIAPRPVIARLSEAKEATDLHSDQLAQAVLLRFAESGELAHHLARLKRSGAGRLQSALDACSLYLPPHSRYTRPEGGLNLWVELPAPLTADAVLRRAHEAGVTFLTGPYFSLRRAHPRALRISFGGLTPQQITRGIQILGEIAERELAIAPGGVDLESDVALV